MGANALFDRENNQGLGRPEFFQQPFDVVLKDSGFGRELRFEASPGDFDVEWGVWDSGFAQDAALDPNLGVTLERIAYATGVPTPTGSLPAGSISYAVSAGPNVSDVGEFLFLRNGNLGFTSSTPMRETMSAVDLRFDINFATGEIGNGVLDLSYADPEDFSKTLQWTGAFGGRARGAFAEFEFSSLTMNRDAALQQLTPDLSRSSMAGFATGANGEAFLGGLSLEAASPAGASQLLLESLQGVFLMNQVGAL